MTLIELAMDKQCQDRCHRIGQVRDVHIYRFVSEYTIESILSRRRTRKDSWITLLFKRESLLQITLVSSRFVIWSVIAILGRK